ncbi:hypothetical protein AB832_06830 [Flavobacteriaceae bacterium (ex Bugula neritina AB1)]|nr:hypothetical protein AB832_06830 [Flavobacteriaceae bacterium (ex Bugula neritina AB1)]
MGLEKDYEKESTGLTNFNQEDTSSNENTLSEFVDNSPEAIEARRLQELADKSSSSEILGKVNQILTSASQEISKVEPKKQFGTIEQETPQEEHDYPKGKKKVDESHQLYLEEIGIETYKQARERGMSLNGASIFLALGANEAGYGNLEKIQEALKHNNFYGLGGSKNLWRYASPDVQSGVQMGLDKLESNWNNAYNRLMDDDVDLEKLDTDLKTGIITNDEGKKSKADKYYNTSQHGEAYGSFLGGDNVLPYVLDRFQTVLSKKLTGIDSEKLLIDAFIQEARMEGNSTWLKELNDRKNKIQTEWNELYVMYKEVIGYLGTLQTQ